MLLGIDMVCSQALGSITLVGNLLAVVLVGSNVVSTPRGTFANTHLAAAQQGMEEAAEQWGERGSNQRAERSQERQESHNVQEFQTFYKDNISLIFRYIYSKVGNREEAEDLTQQTFVKAVRNLDQRRGPQ